MAACQIRRLALVFVLMLSDGCCAAVTLSEGHELPDKMQQGPLTTTEQHADQHVTVHPGLDVTLRCEAGNVSILGVQWTRRDLEPQYVLFYRDGNLDPTLQHPSFTDRVELVHRDLKDGDVSLTLKNVTSRDSGTYECRVKSGGSTRTKRANIKGKPIRAYRLEVTGSKNENFMSGNPPRGHVGPAAAGGAVVLLVAAAVSVAVWRHKRRTDQRSAQPAAADEAGTDQPMLTSAV